MMQNQKNIIVFMKRCREQSYLYAYTDWYECWLLFEKNGEVIVVNYYHKADFKWYDYLIVINEPKIPDDFISALLRQSSRTGDRPKPLKK